MSASALWTEAYRPKNIKEYVFRDPAMKTQFEGWIKERSLPNLLFSGAAGTGKTSATKMLFKELDINPLDILEINASRTNSIDDVRNKITNFVQMMPFGDYKVVLLDEGDFLSPNSQGALRGLIEEYHNTARWVITCNYPNRIIPALHSRFQSFHITKIDQTEFTARVAEILIAEGVQFELDTLDTYVKATYPDLRKCINMVQQNNIDSVLVPPHDSDSGSDDWQIKMVELFKSGKIKQARELLCGKIRPEEMESVYRFCYENLELFGETEKQQDQAVLIIKKGLVDHTICADPEINLAAILIQLARNSE